jgi:hypothetical protein
LKKQIDASEARRQRRKGIGQNLSLCRIWMNTNKFDLMPVIEVWGSPLMELLVLI